MALRLLARAAPFLLGAVAAAIWLRRRTSERPALPLKTGTAQPPPARSGRFDRPPAGAVAPPAGAVALPAGAPALPAGRFARPSEPPPVDIVTVVDDLLGSPH